MLNFYPHSSKWFRPFYPSLCWTKKESEKVVYLTFDDGPNPEVTPYVLNLLKQYNFEATFFCIGDNVKKHPNTYQKVLEEGHAVGNHTQHHPNGFRTPLDAYIEEVEHAAKYIDSNLFRPPYGRIKRSQIKALSTDYQIIMWSMISGDFEDNLDPKRALQRIQHLTEPGSIIVFHDSLKAYENLKYILPKYCIFLKDKGYTSCKLL